MGEREGHVLLYGATGHTGRKVAQRALELGIPLLLAARDPVKLAACAADLGGVPHTAVQLDDAVGLLRALDGATAVLNAAGPFEDTMTKVLQAALEARVHYLDLSGEARVIDRATNYDRAARARGCMVMPAIGFDVVASDCLALHVMRNLPRATRLALGIFGLEGFSRGSGRSIARQAGAPVLVRRNGVLTGTRPGELRRSFMLDGRQQPAVAITWADVVTAWFSTGVPCIEAYFGETPELLFAIATNRALHDTGLGPLASRLVEPFVQDINVPHDDRIPEAPLAVVAEACSAEGARASATLRCPGPYSFTALAAAAVLERVVRGDVEPGFETPARVYGADFVLSLPGVSREDVP